MWSIRSETLCLKTLKLIDMNITKQERLFKEYIFLDNRFWELKEKISQLPLIPLEKPVQKGWEVYFDLRDDIKARKDYLSISKAFNLCARSTYTRNVKQIRRIRANHSLNSFPIYEKGSSNPIPYLSMINEKVYSTLTPDVSKFFVQDPRSSKWVSFKGKYYYLDIPRFWILVKVRPNMHTHYREKGGEIEKELAYIEKRIRFLRLKFSHNYGASYPAYKDRTKVRAKIQKYKKKEIEDITNEKIPREYFW